MIEIRVYIRGESDVYRQGAGDLEAALYEAAVIVRDGYYHRGEGHVDVFPPHRIDLVRVIYREDDKEAAA